MVGKKRKSTRRKGSQPLYAAKHGEEHCRQKKLCVECGKKLEGRRTRWCSDACVARYLVRSDPSEARRQVKKRDKGVCRDCGLDCSALRRSIDAATREAMTEWWGREGEALREKHMRGRRESRCAARRNPPSARVVKNYATHWSWTVKESGPHLERARCSILERHGMAQWWWRKSFWDADHLLEVSRGGGECSIANLATMCCACHARRSSRQATARAARRRAATTRRIPRRRGEACRSRSSERCSRSDLPCRGCRRYRARVLGSGSCGTA